ncbi:MAG TPA: hypothetical protein VGF25_19635 [Thermoleophilaceae bacterium]
MNARLFWKSLGVQAVSVLLLFAVLVALPLPDDFFDDYGFVVGPIAWITCSLVTARVIAIPIAFVLFAALAGGVAGTIVLIVANHWAGMIVALLVFGASCAGSDPSAEAAT